MEASALRAPALPRRPLAAPLLKLRSDEQLVALFRGGSEEAFSVIHDRYRQRLFAYVRQMLATGPRAEAEDVLQDVFVRAYGALRADERALNLRAWLYRVAHNRCIDYLRRPAPPAEEVFQMSRTPLQDPIETAQRRDDLKRLVEDVGRLPEHQRSALLMREIDGMAYADIAEALEVSDAAVKSLLVRARMGLVEAIQARDTDCAVIREDLVDAYDRGVKASGRARKHMRECSGCREYRTTLRGMRRSFAALSPVAGFGPLALAAKALGLGGASGGGAAAGAGALSGTAAACKVAAVVCGAALATGGAAVEVKHLARPDKHPPRHQPVATAPAPTRHQVSPVVAQAPAAAPAVPAAQEPVLPLPVDEPLTETPAVEVDPSATPAPTTTPDPVPSPTETASSEQPTTVSPPSEPAPDAEEATAGEPAPAVTPVATQ